MDAGDENLPSLPPDNMNFILVDTISTKDRPLQEVIQCVLEHEAAGTPIVLTGFNSDTSWPPVILRLLGYGSTVEGWDPTRSCQ